MSHSKIEIRNLRGTVLWSREVNKFRIRSRWFLPPVLERLRENNDGSVSWERVERDITFELVSDEVYDSKPPSDK